MGNSWAAQHKGALAVAGVAGTAVGAAAAVISVIQGGSGPSSREDHNSGIINRHGTVIVGPASGVPTSNSPTLQVFLPVAQNVQLSQATFCSWQLGHNPLPLASKMPPRARVDARCLYPTEPDPAKDSGAAVYSVPSNNDSSKSLGRLPDGSVVTLRCFVPNGDRVSDDSQPQNSSTIWVRITRWTGYLPDVELGGGYSLEQLRALGLNRC